MARLAAGMAALAAALAAMLVATSFASAQTQTVKVCVPVTSTASGIAVQSCQDIASANPLPVTATFAPSGTQDVNLKQILGAAPSLTNPLWVAPATGASFAVTNAGTFAVQAVLNATPSLANGNGVVPTQGGSVYSATNGGYQNLLQGNAVLAAGNPLFAQLTAGSAIAGKVGIDQTTVGTTNAVSLSQINTATALAGAGAVGTGAQRVAVGQDPTTVAGMAPGTTAPGTAPTDAVATLGVALSTEPATLATTGQTIAPRLDLTGRQVTSPWANKENWIRDYGTSSATGTAITVLPSGGSGLYSYLLSLDCTNSNATGQQLTLSDSLSTIFYVPGGGGNNMTFATPLVSSGTATAITATLSASNAAIWCVGTGFKGT